MNLRTLGRTFLIGIFLWGMGMSFVSDSFALRNRPENTGFIFTYDQPPSMELATDNSVSARVVAVSVINFILFFLGLTGVAVIIYAGFLYVTAGGDDAQSEKGKKIILYTGVGIVVIFISFALVNTLLRSAHPDSTGDPERVGIQGQTLK